MLSTNSNYSKKNNLELLRKKRYSSETNEKINGKDINPSIIAITNLLKTKYLNIFVDKLKIRSQQNYDHLIKIKNSLMISSTDSIENLKKEHQEHSSKNLERLKKENNPEKEKVSYFMFYKNNMKNADKNQVLINEIANENKTLVNQLIHEKEKLQEDKIDLKDKLDSVLHRLEKLEKENMELKLRQNLEFFIYYFFEIPQDHKIANITNSLKTLFYFIEESFRINIKNKQRYNQSEIKLLNEICFIEAKYEFKTKNTINIFTKIFYILEERLKNLISYLLEKFKTLDDFLKYVKNATDQFQKLSKAIHYKNFSPYEEFSTLSEKDKDYYKLALTMTCFCEINQSK